MRWRLDYGYDIYDQTSKSYPLLLDPFQMKVLIVIRAFRFSPKKSLEMEAGVMLLSREGNTIYSLYIRLYISTPSVFSPILDTVALHLSFWPTPSVIADVFEYLPIPLQTLLVISSCGYIHLHKLKSKRHISPQSRFYF